MFEKKIEMSVVCLEKEIDFVGETGYEGDLRRKCWT